MTHGDVIRAAIAGWLGLPLDALLRFDVDPASISRVALDPWGARLTAYTIGAAGALTQRRVWAQLPGEAVPDGICLDAEGAIWAASPTTHDCLRLLEGGAVAERVATGRGAFACMLGGADRRTLYVCTADSHDPERQARERNGRIEAFEVTIPGDGLP